MVLVVRYMVSHSLGQAKINYSHPPANDIMSAGLHELYMSPEELTPDMTAAVSSDSVAASNLTNPGRPNHPHAGGSSSPARHCDRGPSDVYSLGMVLLDLIRGRLLTGEERRAFCACSASAHDDSGSRCSSWGEEGGGEGLCLEEGRHGAFITALVDSTFSVSRLLHRRIYSLLPLVEQCLSANPAERPSIHHLLAAVQEAYKFCNGSPCLPVPYPHISLIHSVANLNNMAIGDAQAGLLGEAREKWISALVMDPSNATALWNMSLFRWRTGEIDAVELITVLRRHEMTFGEDALLLSEDSDSSKYTSITSGTCTPPIPHTINTDDGIPANMEQIDCMVLCTNHSSDVTTSASTDVAAAPPLPATPSTVQIYDDCIQAVLDEALLCRHQPARRAAQESRHSPNSTPLATLYPSSFLPSSVVASHTCQQLPPALTRMHPWITHTAVTDAYVLHMASPQISGSLLFHAPSGTFTENSQQRDCASPLVCSDSPKGRHGIWAYLDSSIDSIRLDVAEYAHGNVVMAVPEIMHYYTTPLFVERLVGCDIAPSPEAGHTLATPEGGPSLCYMLLEGQWEDDDYASGWNQADVDSVVEDDDVACTYSSDGSQGDSNLTAAPPRRQYFLVAIGIQGQCAGIMGVVNVEGIYFDQRPTAVSCWSSGASIVVVVSGTGGLLCAVTPPASLGRSVGSITATQLSVDKYTSTSDDIHALLPPASHGASSSVTALDFSLLSQTLASGDSCGDMCVWKCSGTALGEDLPGDTWCFRLQAPPLHLKSRINRIVLSAQYVDAIVALDWRVLFVSLHTQSSTPTLFIRCILDSTCPSPGSLSSACGLLARRGPPRYEAAFDGKEIVLWRVWSSFSSAAENDTTCPCPQSSPHAMSVDVIRMQNPQMYPPPSAQTCEYRYGKRHVDMMERC